MSTAYTLFSQGSADTISGDTGSYTFGVEIIVSQSCPLEAVWFYSPPGAALLPQNIALYQVSGTTLVTSQAATWSGAAGSGWVRAAFTSPPALSAVTLYKACVQCSSGGSQWYAGTPHYWDTGTGENGASGGPLMAVNNAAASPGQCSYNSGTSLAYPASVHLASNYWVDAEVSASSGTWSTTAPLGTETYSPLVVNNNEWNSSALTWQGAWAQSASDWGAVSIQTNSDTTSVKSYPCVEYQWSPAIPVAWLTSLTATFTQSMPTSGSEFTGECAFDILLNGYDTEFMMWVYNVNQGLGGYPVVGTFTSDDGYTWTVYHSSFYFAVCSTSLTSGTVDILYFFNWLIANGYMNPGSTLDIVDFGWEICDTPAGPQAFTVSEYSLAIGPGTGTGGHVGRTRRRR